LESEDECDLPDFSAFKKMRDGARTQSAKLKLLEEKNYELENAIDAPRSKMPVSQVRCV